MYTLNKICVFRADSTKIYIVNIICLHEMKALGLEKLSLHGSERWSWKMLVRDAECLDTKTQRKDRYFNWKFNISAIWKARSASTALQLASVRSLRSWHAVSSTPNPSRKGDVVLTSSPQLWIHTKGPIGSTALVLHVISCSLEKKSPATKLRADGTFRRATQAFSPADKSSWKRTSRTDQVFQRVANTGRPFVKMYSLRTIEPHQKYSI